jgi:hypothetical protein
VELGWFPDDPHAISLWFVRQDKQWSCGRELLVAALTSAAAGEGDVRFRRLVKSPDYVGLVLDSPNGHAEFLVPRSALVEVVAQSESLFWPAVDAWRESLADEWRAEVGS